MVLIIRPVKGPDDGYENGQVADRTAVRRAAVDLMSNAGFSEVTVDDIVASVGISRRTFFRLFAGKHQVVSSDHGVYYDEVCGYLLRSDGDRTLARAAEAAQLVLEGLTAVHSDAVVRAAIVNSDDALVAEESSWFLLYQSTLAEFLTQPQGDTTSLEAEMLSASIVAAVRVTLRDWLADPAIPAVERLRAGIRLLQSDSSALPTRRSVAIIETALSVDEIAARLAE